MAREFLTINGINIEPTEENIAQSEMLNSLSNILTEIQIAILMM